MITLIENNNVPLSLVEAIYTPNQEYFDDYTSNMGMEDNTQVLDALKWKLVEDKGYGVKKVLSIEEDGTVVGLFELLLDGSTAHSSINFSLVPLADFAEPLHTYLQSVEATKLIAWSKPATADETALLNRLNKPDLYSFVDDVFSTFADGEDQHHFITLDLL
tara:strand:- start:990 stop:1475 length:486 start_codon:yes stop_codon:yes gene_type:complete